MMSTFSLRGGLRILLIQNEHQELTAHIGRHDATEERLDKLEAIHLHGRHQ